MNFIFCSILFSLLMFDEYSVFFFLNIFCLVLLCQYLVPGPPSNDFLKSIFSLV